MNDVYMQIKLLYMYFLLNIFKFYLFPLCLKGDQVYVCVCHACVIIPVGNYFRIGFYIPKRVIVPLETLDISNNNSNIKYESFGARIIGNK